jgi:hypothetical protein
MWLTGGQDTFEDAPADQNNATSPTESTTSRSLTGNRTSSSKPRPVSKDMPPTNGTGVHDDDEDDEDEETSKPKSPLLTSHRLSTESLDNVNLEEESQVLPKVPAKGTVSLNCLQDMTNFGNVKIGIQSPLCP